MFNLDDPDCWSFLLLFYANAGRQVQGQTYEWTHIAVEDVMMWPNLNNILHSAVHAACHSSQYCVVFEDHTAKAHDMDFTLSQIIKYYNEWEPEYNNREKDQKSAFWIVHVK